MKRTTSILILMALLAALAASCGEATSTDTTAADATAVTTEDPSAVKFVPDDLPDDLDFGGAETNWLVGDYMDAYIEDFWAEEQNGSVINDKVYETRKNVEDRLNLKIAMEEINFAWADREVYTTRAKQLVMAGDDTFDVIAGYGLASLIPEGGYFYELSGNKYINVDKPWWNKDMQTLMPTDSIYFLAGDGTLALIKHAGCVFFNQDQLDNLGKKENLYELVREGKWTLDKMEEMITDTYQDLNGDTNRDYGDFYGVTYGDQNKFRAMPDAFDCQMYTRTKDGYELTFITERTTDAFTKMQTLVSVNENSYIPGNNTQRDDNIASFGGNYISKIFADGHALFSFSLVGDAAAIYNNSKFTLGMVPIPKYDEAQSDYYTASQRLGYFFIPSSAADADRAGAVIEAWSSDCYRNLMPAYFETTLKARYSTDSDMAEMFDIMRENNRITFGTGYGTTELAINCDVFKNVTNPDFNFVSDMESKRAQTEQQLKDLVEALNELED